MCTVPCCFGLGTVTTDRLAGGDPRPGWVHGGCGLEEAPERRACAVRAGAGSVSRLIRPVAGRPAVGGERQVAALWNIIKLLRTMCSVDGDGCQILALDIIFQVSLLEKKKLNLENEGGRKYEDQEGRAESEQSSQGPEKRGVLLQEPVLGTEPAHPHFLEANIRPP